MTLNKSIKIFLAPILAFILISFFDLSPGNPVVTRMAAVALWMAIWWLTEAVSLAVTALLPIVLLPMLGISDSKLIASQYMDPIIFLFIGGFIIAFAVERWGLHKRIALRILMVVGTKPSSILLGVMLTSFLISMWISNTATVMMLLSAVFAVIYEIEKHIKDEAQQRKIATALLIGLAYSATIGGMATLVGTPTNMIFKGAYEKFYPDSTDMNFFEWSKIAFPMSLALLFSAYFVLKGLFLQKVEHFKVSDTYFSDSYARLGKVSYEEKVVGIIFLLTAILWFTRADIDFGPFVMKGWEWAFPQSKFIHDSTVAIVMAVLLFIIPSKSEKGQALITWNDASRIPFDVVLLFGGGFALAKGVELSHLDNWLAVKLNFFSGMNIYLFILLLCVLVTVISEFASNVASIQLMIPILVSLQKEMDVHPLLLLMPATLAASLGFMLPVATAPNTIVFGSKRIHVQDMFKAGLALDVIGIVLIMLIMMMIH